MLVELFNHAKSVGAIRRANPIVAEYSYIHAGGILLLEQTVEIKNGLRRLWMKPALGHQMSVAIDDHENSSKIET
jgi:hypothetical protein